MDIMGALKKCVFEYDILKFFIIWSPDMILVSVLKSVHVCAYMFTHIHAHIFSM